MKTLILNNYPSPYFTPLFERLTEKYKEKYEGGELTVCYSRAVNPNSGWSDDCDVSVHKYDKIILNNSLTLIRILITKRPEYLICYGYTLTPQIIALLWSLMTRTKYTVIGDANIHCDIASGMKRVMKRIWLKFILRSAHSIPYIGAANKAFWESYDAPPSKMNHVPLVVDNDFYVNSIKEKQDEIGSLQSRYGLTDKVVFVFSGRLIKRKNVNLIIRAMKRVENDAIRLLIIGDGPEREYLERIADNDSRIIFTGTISSALLPVYYAVCDALILPAMYEPWGLVVNEAMACGLAIIAHQRCGSAIDLVNDDNGILLKTFLVDELIDAMLCITDNQEQLQTMKSMSYEKISNWNIDLTSSRLIEITKTTNTRENISK